MMSSFPLTLSHKSFSVSGKEMVHFKSENSHAHTIVHLQINTLFYKCYKGQHFIFPKQPLGSVHLCIQQYVNAQNYKKDIIKV